MIGRTIRMTLPCLLVGAVLLVPCGSASGSNGNRPAVAAPSTPATEITATTARLSGNVYPYGTTTVHIEVGRDNHYGFSTPETTLLYAIAVRVSGSISGLAPATTYHFRLVATNAFGSTDGPDRSFTTLAGAPSPEAITVTPEPGGANRAELRMHH